MLGVVSLLVELVQKYDYSLGTRINYLFRGSSAFVVVVVTKTVDYVLASHPVNP